MCKVIMETWNLINCTGLLHINPNNFRYFFLCYLLLSLLHVSMELSNSLTYSSVIVVKYYSWPARIFFVGTSECCTILCVIYIYFFFFYCIEHYTASSPGQKEKQYSTPIITGMLGFLLGRSQFVRLPSVWEVMPCCTILTRFLFILCTTDCSCWNNSLPPANNLRGIVYYTASAKRWY